MKVKEVIAALQKWNGELEITGWEGEREGLKIVEVNQPGPRVEGPIIWFAQQ